MDFRVMISFIAALIMGFLFIPRIVKVAIRKDLVARPNHRTSHTGRVPNVGGISIFVSFILAFLFASDFSLDNKTQFLVFAIMILFFVGLYDDVMIISAKRKLIGELFAVAAMIFLGNFRLTNLHGFFGVHEIPYFASILLTFFVTIVIINAINLIDGIDGLASGVGMLVSLFYGIYFILIDSIQLSIIAFSLLGALIPFFIYNVFAKRCKIFMGDAGALVLGVLLAALTVMFNEINIYDTEIYHVNNAPVVSICILVLPMFDTIRVFTIRIFHKKSPFVPDKNHLHHMFLALGCNHKQSTGILLFINMIYIGAGLLFQSIPSLFFFAIIFFSCILWSEILRLLIKSREKVKESQCNEKIVVENEINTWNGKRFS
ncbi:MAG: undecaprenyl/decaprenyl-phosphate alpha-N-acetylglucosaminyl 1-phosphate transferase [Prevotellaceae bacterium]|jgi:UDP-N-acetylmuramyl pentapeptide phosphotransferase/UDP-N-acetylglucosamine-1-phosphate transferase|nr:undecaprenyl/decaprenyl-phosphate alpha-N-acetylglucosaminyl 1-phosphate transferase [Prevotellaceae bacterium]